VASLRLPLKTQFIYNPVYAQTNNNYSLWTAGPAIKGEAILLLDADILYDQRILGRLLGSAHEDALVMRPSNELGHEEIKVELDDDGAVRLIGKEVDPKRSSGESLGIEKFSASTTEALFAVLDRRKEINEFYEASFQEVIDGGARIYAVESGGFPCMEIDTPDDLAAADVLARALQ
jgi:choline kinase